MGSVTCLPQADHEPTLRRPLVYDLTVPEIRAYMNGSLVSAVHQSSLNISGAGPFRIGGYDTNMSIDSGQLVDEFRLYNRALSAQEISATWNQALPLPPTISLTAAVEPAAAHPGDPISYTIAFSNTGAPDASNLLISDTLSADITNTLSSNTSGISLTQLPNTRYAWSASSLRPMVVA